MCTFQFQPEISLGPGHSAAIIIIIARGQPDGKYKMGNGTGQQQKKTVQIEWPRRARVRAPINSHIKIRDNFIMTMNSFHGCLYP